MGALSGLSIVDSPESTAAVIAAFEGLNVDNRRVAAETLLRTKQRMPLARP
jgi:hypothetical protein